MGELDTVSKPDAAQSARAGSHRNGKQGISAPSHVPLETAASSPSQQVCCSHPQPRSSFGDGQDSGFGLRFLGEPDCASMQMGSRMLVAQVTYLICEKAEVGASEINVICKAVADLLCILSLVHQQGVCDYQGDP